MHWNILGHDWVVDLLKEHILRDNVRHAYLFTGPQGVGRRTLALRLTQALNCPQPLAAGEPCLTCRTCTQIERMQHADLQVVQADQVRGTLKVDQVRELQHSLSFSPYEARYRVALLLRFEEAHPSAANALLKVLEEPPPKVIMLLTAESQEQLLPTITSRCEVLRLRPVPLAQVDQALVERWQVAPEKARLLAHLCAGRLGYAIHLLESPDSLERRRHWLDEHTRLLNATTAERFTLADTLSANKATIREALQIWLSLWRDIMLHAVGGAVPLTNLDQQDEINNLSCHTNARAAYDFTLCLGRTLDLLDKNVNPRLALETLLLDMPQPQ